MRSAKSAMHACTRASTNCGWNGRAMINHIIVGPTLVAAFNTQPLTFK